MKVASAADWRANLPFETPVVLAEVVPGEDARCFVCGPESEAIARTEIWAFKHPHPHHHHGLVRFYCGAHVPQVKAPPTAPAATRGGTRPTRSARPAPRVERAAPTKRPLPSDAVRAMCPNCFIEVSAKGLCGVCGTQI